VMCNVPYEFCRFFRCSFHKSQQVGL
jgi:hypothetical protein